ICFIDQNVIPLLGDLAVILFSFFFPLVRRTRPFLVLFGFRINAEVRGRVAGVIDIAVRWSIGARSIEAELTISMASIGMAAAGQKKLSILSGLERICCAAQPLVRADHVDADQRLPVNPVVYSFKPAVEPTQVIALKINEVVLSPASGRSVSVAPRTQ